MKLMLPLVAAFAVLGLAHAGALRGNNDAAPTCAVDGAQCAAKKAQQCWDGAAGAMVPCPTSCCSAGYTCQGNDHYAACRPAGDATPAPTPAPTPAASKDWAKCYFDSPFPFVGELETSDSNKPFINGADPSFIGAKGCEVGKTCILPAVMQQCDSNPADRQPFGFVSAAESTPTCGGPGFVAFGAGKNPCMIHQSFGEWRDPIANPTFTSGHYENDDEAAYTDKAAQWYKAWNKCTGGDANSVCLVKVVEPSTGKEVEAASFGHGVLDGQCGSMSLIRYNSPDLADGEYRYLVNMQQGMRAWSLELEVNAAAYLAPDNSKAQTACDVPDVVALQYDSALLKAIGEGTPLKVVHH